MDLEAVATEVAAILAGIGFSDWDFVPDSVPKFPAGVVGVPTSVNYGETLKTALVTFPVTVAFSAADAKDCQSRLKRALGTTDDTSVFNALNNITGDSFRSLRVATAQEPRYVDEGNARVLAVDFTAEAIVTK